ncbi:GntR family transcriptional regulator [Azospirillum sp. TSH100]|uniref:GntR family transcriptional regulator n=1 Tax=Azospirillum sp. TSH100 TaxID=652764 RepID=UPI000D6054B6|nr:GntR family transcriptional regulator [Azospirillum sp. TSH100]PWC84620.1 GntR family transcriptional regulator [Azospirillum sp. TSH100]QCG91036.1 GntR family transcriptional regulator [Azospirillum sp. TSH100]
MALVRDNATALYRQIADQLRDEIAARLFEPSGRLPTENEIGARFGVSRVTVRLALDRLETEGLIERRKGKGTFTAGKRVQHPLDRLRSFHESLRLQGLDATMRPLSARMVVTPPDLREDFGARCLEVCRLHLVDGEPVALGRSLLPPALEPVDWQAAGHRPIYGMLQDVVGKPVGGADIEVKAAAAEAEVAVALGLPVGAPVLVMDRRSVFVGGGCADRSVFHIRSERYSFILSHSWDG